MGDTKMMSCVRGRWWWKCYCNRGSTLLGILMSCVMAMQVLQLGQLMLQCHQLTLRYRKGLWARISCLLVRLEGSAGQVQPTKLSMMWRKGSSWC